MRSRSRLASSFSFRLEFPPELPISAYRGMLKGVDLGNIEPEKEPDREFR